MAELESDLPERLAATILGITLGNHRAAELLGQFASPFPRKLDLGLETRVYLLQELRGILEEIDKYESEAKKYEEFYKSQALSKMTDPFGLDIFRQVFDAYKAELDIEFARGKRILIMRRVARLIRDIDAAGSSGAS